MIPISPFTLLGEPKHTSTHCLKPDPLQKAVGHTCIKNQINHLGPSLRHGHPVPKWNISAVPALDDQYSWSCNGSDQFWQGFPAWGGLGINLVLLLIKAVTNMSSHHVHLCLHFPLCNTESIAHPWLYRGISHHWAMHWISPLKPMGSSGFIKIQIKINSRIWAMVMKVLLLVVVIQ